MLETPSRLFAAGRALLNQHQMVATLTAILVLIAALAGLMTRVGSAGAHAAQAYYYDLNTGRVFVASLAEIPPVEAPSGGYRFGREKRIDTGLPAGVRAHLFSCTSCEDPRSRYIGYLERFTLEAKRKFANPEQHFVDTPDKTAAQQEMEVLGRGHQVARAPRRGEAIVWVPAISDEGMRIEHGAIDRCINAAIVPDMCLPGP